MSIDALVPNYSPPSTLISFVDVVPSIPIATANMSSKIKLLCWVQGDELDSVFGIEIGFGDRTSMPRGKPSFEKINPRHPEILQGG